MFSITLKNDNGILRIEHVGGHVPEGQFQIMGDDTAGTRGAGDTVRLEIEQRDPLGRFVTRAEHTHSREDGIVPPATYHPQKPTLPGRSHRLDEFTPPPKHELRQGTIPTIPPEYVFGGTIPETDPYPDRAEFLKDLRNLPKTGPEQNAWPTEGQLNWMRARLSLEPSYGIPTPFPPTPYDVPPDPYAAIPHDHPGLLGDYSKKHVHRGGFIHPSAQTGVEGHPLTIEEGITASAEVQSPSLADWSESLRTNRSAIEIMQERLGRDKVYTDKDFERAALEANDNQPDMTDVDEGLPVPMPQVGPNLAGPGVNPAEEQVVEDLADMPGLPEAISPGEEDQEDSQTRWERGLTAEIPDPRPGTGPESDGTPPSSDEER